MGGRDRRIDAAATEPLEVEVELVKERAEALGRAGRKLEDAVAAYRRATDEAGLTGEPLGGDVQNALLAEITAQLYRLIVQRECSGARQGNLEAIRVAYDVPEAAVRRL
jgi:hypothetical protein